MNRANTYIHTHIGRVKWNGDINVSVYSMYRYVTRVLLFTIVPHRSYRFQQKKTKFYVKCLQILLYLSTDENSIGRYINHIYIYTRT